MNYNLIIIFFHFKKLYLKLMTNADDESVNLDLGKAVEKVEESEEGLGEEEEEEE